MNNYPAVTKSIAKLIAGLAKRGEVARLTAQLRGRSWLVAVVDPNCMGKEVILVAADGNRYLSAIKPTLAEALAHLDALCAPVQPDAVGPFPI